MDFPAVCLPIPEMKQSETACIISSISVSYDYQSCIRENTSNPAYCCCSIKLFLFIFLWKVNALKLALLICYFEVF